MAHREKNSEARGRTTDDPSTLLRASRRRKTVAGDKEDGGLLVSTLIKQDITKVPHLPALRVQQVVMPSLTFWIRK
jgi:hypothetical protein